MTPPYPTAPAIAVEPKQRTGTPGSIQADRLFRDSREIRIEHNGKTYRLRITRNDKLILTT